ncbi:DNA-processing protein DprA [Microbacterium sp. MYb64]|uniref:DNA-processing protein DprA n=1 Tax=Microbacterium sp. MYb64 TaxID=1848691 RepID=UPI002158179C|nr:DNA-processing protein DprA [Microbacterium sp. MYb64]
MNDLPKKRAGATDSTALRAPSSAEMKVMLRDLREDSRVLAAATRIRPDAGDPDVRDGLIWGLVTEPGDGVAGALVAALGATEALEVVAGGHGGSVGLADDERPAAGALREGRRRWAPRLDPDLHLGGLRTAARMGVRLLLPSDPEWPTSMADLGAHAPLALWLRGDAAALAGSGVALVGARASSSYGEHVAGEFAGELAAEGRVIVSGGAYGIDGTAHRAALRAGGMTVAVLAGGVDRPYPSGHAQLFERIAASGALVSEVACGVAPTRWRFLARNRLISALSAATIVVEAGQRSGSLNTAGHAAALGRPLGAVPGPITSTASAGCHRLLRDYDACCVTSVADVRELLGGAPVAATRRAEDPDMVRLADALNVRAARGSTELAQRSGLSIDRVEALLGVLELDGGAVRSERGWRSVLR